MRIIFNPKDGAPITQWIFEGEKKNPHYPLGFELQNGKIANGLMQYTDLEADEILQTYEFLRGVTLQEAKEIIDQPADPTFKCEFPNCEFVTRAKIGLEGHKRKHKLSTEALKPIVDPALIPVSTGEKVLTPTEIAKQNDPFKEHDIPNGADRDGIDWYGEGLQVENRNNDSFNGVRQVGKGHFVG